MREAGNTNCHAHSADAFGYLRCSANGITARPNPRATSSVCCRFTASRWLDNREVTAEGSRVSVRARGTCSIPPTSMRSTFRYRNKTALNA